MNKLFILLTLILMPFLSIKASDSVSVDATDSNSTHEKEKEPKTASAQINDPTQVTYILQVSSNLGCDNLDIELTSNKLDTPKFLKFNSSAYAGVDLPQGDYSFGNVICLDKDGRQTFDVLSEKIMPLSFSAGKVYYGGRLIFQKVDNPDSDRAPNVLDNCTQMISRKRVSSNECRDGVGVETSAQTRYQVNVFAPEVTDKDIEVVRSALSMSESQLLYLPIGYKKN